MLYQPSELVTSTRTFICRGSVWEVINKTTVKERILFLFNDMLLVAKKVKSDVGQERYNIKSMVTLDAMQLSTNRSGDPHTQLLSSSTFQ